MKNEFDNLNAHNVILSGLGATYRAKNADYGDSFHKSFDKYGPLSAVVRMDDKLHRAHQLLCESGERKVKDATVEDTLLDLANYAIMTVIELRRRQFELREVIRDATADKGE